MLLRRAIYGLVAASFVSGGSATAQEWWGDDSYWKSARSAPAAAADAAPPGERDVFGRPIIRVSPIAGLDHFDPARDSWVYAHPAEAPVQYAQRSSDTMTDAGNPTREPGAWRESAAAVIQDTEAEKQRLDRSGFPQYNP